jgi:hypothetical protein
MALSDFTLEETKAPTFRIDRNGMTAVREFLLTPWADTTVLLEDVLGSQQVTGGSLLRTGADTFPGKDWLILESVEIEPIVDTRVNEVDANGVATCDQGAKVVANYKTQEYDQASGGGQGSDQPTDNPVDTYYTLRVRGSNQMITHSAAAVEWELVGADLENQQVPPDIKPVHPISILNVSITWHNVPDPPWVAIITGMGTTNESVFLGLQPGLWLFTGFNANRSSNPDGSRKWEIEYEFDARIVDKMQQVGQWKDETGTNVATIPGWNFFLRPDPWENDNPWQRIVDKKSQSPLIAKSDYADLFAFV